MGRRACLERRGPETLPRCRHQERGAVRRRLASAGPRCAAGHEDRGALCDRAGDGSAQAARPGLHARRRPGAKRHQSRATGAAAFQPAQQPARHRVCRSTRHRALRAARMRRPAASAAFGAGRPAASDHAVDAVPRAAAEAAPRRSAFLHDRHRDARPRRGTPPAWRRAREPRRGVVRNACRARLSAAVSQAGAPHGDRRRRPARHDLAGEFFYRQPGRLRLGDLQLRGRRGVRACLPETA